MFELLHRSAPFAALGRGALESVLDMLSGRYPSEQFAELRPRLTWDRTTGLLTGRPGAQRLAVTSGGTIPDRGLFGVFLAGGDGPGPPGRRAGRGDGLRVAGSATSSRSAPARGGSSTSPATRCWCCRRPGCPAGCRSGRATPSAGPAELGRAHGEFVREISGARRRRRRQPAAPPPGWTSTPGATWSTTWPSSSSATGVVPDEKTLVVERFRDELGDWRIVLHSPYGAAVHAPWALVIAARMRERYGVDVAAMHADDGIVLRLPDVEYENGPPDFAEFVALDPQTLEAEVTAEIGGAAIFAARFRECAARALLLPRRQIGKRQPLWQQRQRATQLLEVASAYPSFPIVAEAVRECLSDVFDVPALVGLMRELEARTVRIVEVTTQSPSPFASSLLFGYVAQFLYEGDSPLAEKRAAALTVDPTLLAELLGHGDGLALRDLLDPNALADIESELQRRRRDPARPQRRRDRRSAAHSRAADDHRGRPAQHRGRRRRARWPNWRPAAGRSRCGSAARCCGPTRPTPRSCGTRSAPRCRRASPSRCWPRSTIRSAGCSAGTPAPTGRSSPRSRRSRVTGWRIQLQAYIIAQLVMD